MAAAARTMRWLAGLFALLAMLAHGPAEAHPAPFSYLDIELDESGAHVRLTLHVVDAAHELGVSDPEELLARELTDAERKRLTALLSERIDFNGARIAWGDVTAATQYDALRLTFTVDGADGGRLSVDTDLFPYDPQHQTFVNIYDEGTLAQQWLFTGSDAPRTYYRGNAAGAWEVMKTFVPAGAWHILIGPDHLLFLVGLMLLGGGWRRTAMIVTAFTIGHSVTLSLAALSIWSLPAWIIEPAIALTIVVVGADNLMRGEGRDLRPAAALLFGLIHGFGFASVLTEFGLPPEALGWSLFGFNLGVEIGQLAFVIPLAAVIGWLWSHRPAVARKLNLSGSIVVIAAGVYWFVQRTFLAGGA